MIKCPSPPLQAGTWQQPLMWTGTRDPRGTSDVTAELSWNIQASAPACPGSPTRLEYREGSPIIFGPCLRQSLGWQLPMRQLPEIELGRIQWVLKTLALSVMEPDRGENAWQLWLTEGSTVERSERHRETRKKNWTQLRQTDGRKAIVPIKGQEKVILASSGFSPYLHASFKHMLPVRRELCKQWLYSLSFRTYNKASATLLMLGILLHSRYRN